MDKPAEENLLTNPFMTILQTNFEVLYLSLASSQSTLLVPCASSLLGVQINQVFIETHILKRSHIPGNFLNLIGQGVEIKDGTIMANFGFKEQRVCNILKEENFFAHNSTLKVICIDKPLQGPYENDFTNIKSEDEVLSLYTSLDSESIEERVNSWLFGTPIHKILEEKIKYIEDTYIITTGLEREAAEFIHEISLNLHSQLDNMFKVNPHPALARDRLQEIIERFIYIRLYPFIWKHLTESLTVRESILQKGIHFLHNDKNLLISSLQVDPSLCSLDVSLPAEQLKIMENMKTPFEKLDCLKTVYKLLITGVEEELKKYNAFSRSSVEITGDDVLSLFIATIAKSLVPNALSHLAHMDMVLFSEKHMNRMEISGYYLTTYHSALSYIQRSFSTLI